jgi:hypothetical protein
VNGRGTDTSHALTEVRNVLSRARTARRKLEKPTEPQRVDDPSVPAFYRPLRPDPDAEEMRRALDKVIVLLEHWERTGRSQCSSP